jgi:hypothetical protein
MAAGIKNGEILRGPPSISAACSRSIMSNPPIPEPMCTPTRSSFSGVTFSPDIFMRFIRGRDGQVDEAPHLLQFLFFDEVQRVEALDLGGNLTGKFAVESKLGDAGHAAFAGQHRASRPSSVVLPTPQIKSEARHYHPASQTYFPAFACLPKCSRLRPARCESSRRLRREFRCRRLLRNAMTSSTVSSESAPRSSTNEALGVASPSSTPSCSTIICFTFSSTAAMFFLACLD